MQGTAAAKLPIKATEEDKEEEEEEATVSLSAAQ